MTEEFNAWRVQGYHKKQGQTTLCILDELIYDEDSINMKLRQIERVYEKNLTNNPALNFIDIEGNFMCVNIEDFSYIKFSKTWMPE